MYHSIFDCIVHVNLTPFMRTKRQDVTINTCPETRQKDDERLASRQWSINQVNDTYDPFMRAKRQDEKMSKESLLSSPHA